MQVILLLFILVPIIEIAVFIQVGDILGLGSTIVIVLITAVLGVNLLKKQGLKAWSEIQLKMAQGQLPAIEMASAAQLLFAGGLLLTPGFVTDAVGFSLMVPSVRRFVAGFLMSRWTVQVNQFSQSSSFETSSFETNNNFEAQPTHTGDPKKVQKRTIEGEFEDRSE